jgi:hypothetical protein
MAYPILAHREDTQPRSWGRLPSRGEAFGKLFDLWTQQAMPEPVVFVGGRS